MPLRGGIIRVWSRMEDWDCEEVGGAQDGVPLPMPSPQIRKGRRLWAGFHCGLKAESARTSTRHSLSLTEGGWVRRRYSAAMLRQVGRDCYIEGAPV